MKIKRGFTLIELLIVIGILGILAIGLIAALDPLEQMRKARDTSTRNAVEDFYNAALRYYAIQEEFPWTVNAVTSTTLLDITGTYVQDLIDAGELKAIFTDDTSKLNKVWITSTNPDLSDNMDDIAVCFAPESKSIKGDDNSKYTNAGVVNAASCPTNDYSSVTCYWCVK
ncbi:hypothetical protein COT75_00645 [Candidatus Beckwithbacteria bacterium CG10_big_fil_rev_8_21_14_0_10_34_10]|uniref:Type II secretion system protein GspG C-terminal domain-containing protein n=1 Tax=Candidatus Beckwithbacteria bacterium CG10_big_fil_rev_8_21_14_0_10_34_10 TaxID=1974495 RepID=A0A2H0WAJ5_9BACT|nr:MAG: hypothetical protein COT75_00645 [Candidatus Beckwithbacteria bacterium CG10_big_fil_rev_8_21_14_0_10_34_10]